MDTDILPPRIPTPSSNQVRFRKGLDDRIQNGMSKISIGPPALPLERDLESQLEDLPMVEEVRAEDRETVVNADRRGGRRNDGEVTKQKTNIPKRKNEQRFKQRKGTSQSKSRKAHKKQSNK